MTCAQIRIEIANYYRDHNYAPARGDIAADEAAEVVNDATFFQIGDLGWCDPDLRAERINGFLFRLCGVDFYRADVGAKFKLSGKYSERA